MQIDVIQLPDLTSEIQNQVADLYRQLNADNTQRPLKEILRSDNNVLVIICKIDSKVVGTSMMSLSILLSVEKVSEEN